MSEEDLRGSMRAALLTAMRARDALATNAIRSALAAIDNAEAVPMTREHQAGAKEAALGVGAGEVTRRDLSAAQVRAIVEQEISERSAAADELPAAQSEIADRLRAEAAILRAQLGSPSSR